MFLNRPNFALPTAALLALAVLFLAGCAGLSNPFGGRGDAPPAGSASDSAIKLLVAETGMLRVTRDELRAAGLPLETLSADTLRLTQAGEQVAYHIDREGDALIFYGRAPDNRYSRVRPYILQAGAAGVLMQQADAAESDATPFDTITQTVRFEENYVYEQRAAETGSEVWFWQRIASAGNATRYEINFDLPAVEAGSAELVTSYWGLTFSPEANPDHDFTLLLNGTPIADVTFDGQIVHQERTRIDGTLLRDGQNTLTIDNSAPGAARTDQFYFNWFEIEYAAPLVAIDDRLAFAGAAGGATISGFSREPLIFDVSNPDGPVLLTGWRYANGNAQLTVTAGSAIEAVATAGYRAPQAFAPLRESAWQTAERQADLVIVTTDELLPALGELIAAREAQGLRVAALPVGEIYDAFGHGDATPESIRAFLRYALTNWQAPQPRYLLLVGDATTDMLGYGATIPDEPILPPNNVVPSMIVQVNFTGETVSDARLADIDDDGRPDLAVGRWPLDSARDVRDVVQRTLAYEQGSSAERAIFSFDGTSTEFSNFTDTLLFQAEFPTAEAALFNGPTSAELLDAWSQGAWLLSYVGHGSLQMWGADEVLSSSAVTQLRASGAPPIVLQFSCLTGQFAYPRGDSISETMLKQSNGPVLLIASTSLTLSTHQAPFAAALLRELQNPQTLRVGDALQTAKLALDTRSSGLQEISDTFGLIGDPSALILRPAAADAGAVSADG